MTENLGDDLLIQKDALRKPVLQRLEEAIINFDLKPGDRLIETRLSKAFGVSRGPIREAILELESLGLVERVQFKGSVVSTLTERDIAELNSCRMVIEKLALRTILESDDIKKIAVEKLKTILTAMAKSEQEKNLTEFLTLDFKFHDELIHLTSNNLMEEIWKPIKFRLRRYMFLNSRNTHIPLNEAIEQHNAIVEAIAASDFDKVAELMENHHCWS